MDGFRNGLTLVVNSSEEALIIYTSSVETITFTEPFSFILIWFSSVREKNEYIKKVKIFLQIVLN